MYVRDLCVKRKKFFFICKKKIVFNSFFFILQTWFVLMSNHHLISYGNSAEKQCRKTVQKNAEKYIILSGTLYIDVFQIGFFLLYDICFFVDKWDIVIGIGCMVILLQM